MKRFVVALALGLLATGAAIAQITVEGVTYPAAARVSGAELALNGAGLRTRFMFNVYTIALYLPQKTGQADEVLAAAGPKRIEIVTLRALTGEQFVDALVKAMRKNHSEQEMAALQPRVDQFAAIMRGLQKTEAGTRVFIDWVPGTGTVLAVDEQVTGQPVPGEDFYRALLRIWIGAQPIQKDLKTALLGGRS